MSQETSDRGIQLKELGRPESKVIDQDVQSQGHRFAQSEERASGVRVETERGWGSLESGRCEAGMAELASQPV